MLIDFTLTRTKNKGIIDQGYIKVDIENVLKDVPIDNNKFIDKLIEIIQSVLSEHITQLPDIKRYGYAYIDKLIINGITVEQDDIITLSEEEFKTELNTKMPNLSVKWNKQQITLQ